jgi:hypothetical protein
VSADAMAGDVFAGWPNCDALKAETATVSAAKEMCAAHQQVYVEGSCNDQQCQSGDCSACYSESSCEGGSFPCAWDGNGCSEI